MEEELRDEFRRAADDPSAREIGIDATFAAAVVEAEGRELTMSGALTGATIGHLLEEALASLAYAYEPWDEEEAWRLEQETLEALRELGYTGYTDDK